MSQANNCTKYVPLGSIFKYGSYFIYKINEDEFQFLQKNGGYAPRMCGTEMGHYNIKFLDNVKQKEEAIERIKQAYPDVYTRLYTVPKKVKKPEKNPFGEGKWYNTNGAYTYKQAIYA